jgi:hypothetical protein
MQTGMTALHTTFGNKTLLQGMAANGADCVAKQAFPGFVKMPDQHLARNFSRDFHLWIRRTI